MSILYDDLYDGEEFFLNERDILSFKEKCGRFLYITLKSLLRYLRKDFDLPFKIYKKLLFKLVDLTDKLH